MAGILILVVLTIFSCGSEESKPQTPRLPEVSTIEVSEIEYTAAKSGGNVINDGGFSVTSKGVCWSTNPNPTINDSKTEDGSGGGLFTSNITNLLPNTFYYLRAYATNSNGTSYGISYTFKTNQYSQPILEFEYVKEITGTSMKVSFSITSDGGFPITAKGVCWSTNPNPTINDSKTSNGTGLAKFDSYLTGLLPSTVYNIRGYAINSNGIAYSTNYTVTTSYPPNVVTGEIAVNSISSIIGGGTIINNNINIAKIEESGLCYGTSPNPTKSDNISLGGSTTVIKIQNLNIGVKYYVRYFATNSAGTTYGQEKTISIPFPSIVAGPTDIDGNVYNAVVIGSKTWMLENLKTTKLSDGTPIQISTTADNWSNLTSPAYCWYNNDEPTYKSKYGALYNGFTVATGKLCPTGWHVPNEEIDNAEWKNLEFYVDGYITNRTADDIGGGNLKEVGTTNWLTPNTGATNKSKFTALPGGYRKDTGEFDGVYLAAWYWSSTTGGGSIPSLYFRQLNYNNASFNSFTNFINQNWGMSVRCIKD